MEREGKFIPPCTRNVFLKIYSKADSQPYFWSYEDKMNYVDEIKKVFNKFKEEYGNLIWRYNTQQEAFKNWCSGLPSVLDTCYYYNRSAVEDVKNILEETDAEANKYTEQQAEELLTSLIYRELMRASMH